MKKLMIISAMFSLVFLSACSKDDAPAPVSKSQLLTTGTWKLTAVVSDNDGNGTYETDDFLSFPECFKDNFYTYKANNEVEMNEGATKCDPSDPQTEVSNWSLANNETNIIIDSDTYILTELNTTTLKMKQELGGNRSSIITFTKR